MSDNDFVRLHLSIGTRNIPCSVLNFGWPPPEYILFNANNSLVGLSRTERKALPTTDDAFVLQRETYSRISDKDASKMNRIARGAEYRYLKDL